MIQIETTMTKPLKLELSRLIKILAEGEYQVMTSDGGDTYMFLHAQSNHRAATSVSWADLCMSYIPRKLGINYLIIPANSEFNIARYLLDYYDTIVQSEKIKETVVDDDHLNGAAGYALDGSM